MVYINDVHILLYVLIAFLGGIVGQFIDYMDKAFLNEKKILSKETFMQHIKIYKINYILVLLNAIIYIALLYKFKISLNLLRFIILTPMLISAFIVDYKIQIIPNRLNLTIFEVGLVFLFVFGFSNLTIAKDMLFGMLIGGGIFLLITLIGGLIAGKEAMGLGDVKLMGALGLYFGVVNSIIISVLSFLIGGIISIIIIILRKNREDGYIPFGPFIVLATFATIFIPTNLLFTILMKIFSLGLY